MGLVIFSNTNKVQLTVHIDFGKLRLLQRKIQRCKDILKYMYNAINLFSVIKSCSSLVLLSNFLMDRYNGLTRSSCYVSTNGNLWLNSSEVLYSCWSELTKETIDYTVLLIFSAFDHVWVQGLIEWELKYFDVEKLVFSVCWTAF